MCGRYVLGEVDGLTERFNLRQLPLGFFTHYNVAPGQQMPVVVAEGDRNAAVLMKWGLIPSWAKDPKIGYRTINARAEGVADKPSFRTPFKRQRCIVPASGFYEWLKAGGGKTPYFIHRKDGELVGFAGLWDRWRDPDGHEIQSYSIITTEPNELVAPIHNRMPAILGPDRSVMAAVRGDGSPRLDARVLAAGSEGSSGRAVRCRCLARRLHGGPLFYRGGCVLTQPVLPSFISFISTVSPSDGVNLGLQPDLPVRLSIGRCRATINQLLEDGEEVGHLVLRRQRPLPADPLLPDIRRPSLGRRPGGHHRGHEFIGGEARCPVEIERPADRRGEGCLVVQFAGDILDVRRERRPCFQQCLKQNLRIFDGFSILFFIPFSIIG